MSFRTLGWNSAPALSSKALIELSPGTLLNISRMIVYLNGCFIPEEQAFISIHDRGFLYGDGLFEAVRVYDGKPFLWSDHQARFEHGCRVLQLTSPLGTQEIRTVILEVLRQNNLQDGLVRFTLTRGTGLRGYSPKGADKPTLVVTPFRLPALPASYRAVVSRIQLPDHDPIADFKHLNKLHQILARAEADAAGVEEAVLANKSGFVVEGTTTNLFWVNRGVVETPPVRGILAGTTRAHVFRLCQRLNLPITEAQARPEELARMDGVFVTSCAAEIMEVSELDGQPLHRSPRVQDLKRAYHHE